MDYDFERTLSFSPYILKIFVTRDTMGVPQMHERSRGLESGRPPKECSSEGGYVMFTLRFRIGTHELTVPWLIILIALVALAVAIYVTPSWALPVPSAGPPY